MLWLNNFLLLLLVPDICSLTGSRSKCRLTSTKADMLLDLCSTILESINLSEALSQAAGIYCLTTHQIWRLSSRAHRNSELLFLEQHPRVIHTHAGGNGCGGACSSVNGEYAQAKKVSARIFSCLQADLYKRMPKTHCGFMEVNVSFDTGQS